jgi:hypothetical protein
MKLSKIVRLIGLIGAAMIFAHTIVSIVKTFPNGGNPPLVTTEDE